MPTGVYKRKPTIELFLEKVTIESDACWNWVGSLKPQGYGEIRIRGKNIYAHRFSYEYFNDEKIPKGLCIDHICDNKKCVNPAHLRVSTYSDNIKRGSLPAINKKRGKVTLFLNEAARICGT